MWCISTYFVCKSCNGRTVMCVQAVISEMRYTDWRTGLIIVCSLSTKGCIKVKDTRKKTNENAL